MPRQQARVVTPDGTIEAGSIAADQPANEGEEQASRALAVNVPATQFSQELEFQQGETAFPLLRLAQGLTKEVANGAAAPGEYVLTGYEPLESVTIIPTAIARTRVRRNPKNNAEILCQSPDAIRGIGDPGILCAGCAFADWTEDARGNRYPPECAFTFNYLAWSVDHQTLVQLMMRRTQIPVTRVVNTMIQTKGYGNFAITLGSMPQRNAKGSYHVMTATPTRGVDDEHFEAARMMMAMPADEMAERMAVSEDEAAEAAADRAPF